MSIKEINHYDGKNGRVVVEYTPDSILIPEGIRLKRINELSDGYHTFDELYEFRKLYNAALFNEWARQEPKYNKVEYSDGRTLTVMYDKHWESEQPMYNVHKSWKHNDGEPCFGGGWFIVSAMLPIGLISNHYKAKDWDLFQVPEVEKALFEFDGHTAEDVRQRLEDYLKQK